MSHDSPQAGFFESLQEGLQEGIQFARGELNLRTTVVPAPPPELQAKDILRLRQQFNMSQGVFARVINVSTKTVQSWEQGDRKPSQASLRLLQIVAVSPQMVFDIVGLRAEKHTSVKGA